MGRLALVWLFCAALAFAEPFEPELARKTGADEYGMRQYVLVFLRKGPNHGKNPELQRAHMDNIAKLARDKTLILAGPFGADGELRGIYLLDVRTLEEARKLTESDPLVKSGNLIMKLHPWYGSAALMLVPSLHEKVAEKKS